MKMVKIVFGCLLLVYGFRELKVLRSYFWAPRRCFSKFFRNFAQLCPWLGIPTENSL